MIEARRQPASADSHLDLPEDFRRQPLRLAVAAGLVITTIASLLPWISGTSGFGGPVALNGYAGPGDGGFLTIFGIGMGVLVLARWAAEANAAPMRLLPALIGVILILTTITTQLDAATEIRGIEFEGGNVALTPAFWAATGGALLMAMAGIALTVQDRLRRGPWFRTGDLRQAVGRRTVVPVVTAIAGAFIGFAAILVAATSALESAFVLIFVVGAVFGGMLGGWLGYRVGRWLMLTPPVRRSSR
jgi:hypothetical protein